MEPLLPEHRDLEDLAMELARLAGGLETILAPAVTRQSIIQLLCMVNTYYSNRIEGHNTHPADIERAMRQEFVKDPRARDLQEEARAHVQVEGLATQKLLDEPELNICAPQFLCWIHKEFFERVPHKLRISKNPDTGEEVEVVPGAVRVQDVTVGHYIPPPHEVLPAFLDRFAAVYRPDRLSGTQRVIAMAASHHRLMWIHPFMDGNGRVVRLFTAAYATRIELAGYGLWSVSRGLARRQTDYLGQLSSADSPRRHDYDGRGPLSLRTFVDFCRFFLETCIDQITYMRSVLALDGLEERVMNYVVLRAGGIQVGAHTQKLPPEAGLLLREALRRGEIARGEAGQILGCSDRKARQILSQLLKEDLLLSDSPKGAVRLGFPVHVLRFYLPEIYPEGVTN